MKFYELRCPACYRRRLVEVISCLLYGFPPCRTWKCPEAER